MKKMKLPNSVKALVIFAITMLIVFIIYDVANYIRIHNYDSSEVYAAIEKESSYTQSSVLENENVTDDTVSEFADEVTAENTEYAEVSSKEVYECYEMQTEPKMVTAHADNSYEVDGWIYINEPNQRNSTYMGVHCITNTASAQYEWLQTHDWYYDNEGICCYDGRTLVALTPIFGGIGTYVDLLLEDGTVMPCIIGDVKANSDTYGHWNGGSLNVIEIIVSAEWYNGHENKYYPNVLAYR